MPPSRSEAIDGRNGGGSDWVVLFLGRNAHSREKLHSTRAAGGSVDIETGCLRPAEVQILGAQRQREREDGKEKDKEKQKQCRIIYCR